MTNIQNRIEQEYKNITIPNGITYGGLLFAFIGIYLVIKNEIILAILFLTLTDVFDLADGYIAKKFNMHSPIGADLDTLVDIIAFVIPPFIIALIYDNQLLLIASVFMVGCGVYQLARFNVEKTIAIGYRKGISISPPAHLILYGNFIQRSPHLFITNVCNFRFADGISYTNKEKT